MGTKIGQSTLGEMLPLFIVIFLLLIFIIFCFYMVVYTLRAKKKGQKVLKQNITDKNASLSTLLKHTVGLPIPENTLCRIYSCPEKYVIEANGQSFNLSKEKVSGLTMKTDIEIQNSYVSSAGGAIGGALLFGPVGALIGGRAKKKTDKTVNNFLIFTYSKESTVDYIAFNATGNFKVMNFIKEFNSTNTGAHNEVDL